ncbi:hypothetical protein EJ08DRAFT_703298 [Tothia fuscella]|uniref:Uncharacterized protein n=1 Tax=Tothia fuscella TaxID=1048955 RepID=A0A9P4NEM5_9PEZI|nr:hypothetical protein EJ08DRAFT_703298 [Tothia fuscella]
MLYHNTLIHIGIFTGLAHGISNTPIPEATSSISCDFPTASQGVVIGTQPSPCNLHFDGAQGLVIADVNAAQLITYNGNSAAGTVNGSSVSPVYPSSLFTSFACKSIYVGCALNKGLSSVLGDLPALALLSPIVALLKRQSGILSLPAKCTVDVRITSAIDPETGRPVDVSTIPPHSCNFNPVDSTGLVVNAVGYGIEKTAVQKCDLPVEWQQYSATELKIVKSSTSPVLKTDGGTGSVLLVYDSLACVGNLKTYECAG